MHEAPLPLTREVVLIGGGHAHALVLRRWGMAPVPGARLTLIDPNPAAPYTGMLPGHVAGHYSRAALEIDLVKLARFAGARLIAGRVAGLDPARQVLTVPGRPPIPYDLASLDIGIGSAPSGVAGFTEHGIAAKPLGPFAEAWQRFMAKVAAGTPAHIAVLGGGVGGVELAMAMDHALQAAGHTPQITVIEARRALNGVGRAARAKILARLSAQDITLREDSAVACVSAESVVLADGTEVPARFCVGAAGATPQPWLRETGLTNAEGYVSVGPDLRALGHKTLYAAGDCADLSHAPRPKAGVYAVRAAPTLYHNLRADLTSSARRQFYPQRDFLKLISLGHRAAVMEKWGLAIAGPWLWRWKDRIDRAFMDKFHRLPPMPRTRVPANAAKGVRHALGQAPPCGGCGAKVSSQVLGAVLSGLDQPERPDIQSAPGDDAAIVSLGGATQVVSTDHLRAFTLDPFLLGQIASLHALGDIWAMGAAPQSALAQIILPRMKPSMQEAWLREIMTAAGAVFAEAGAAIVGGHTTLGAELSVGFTVTGLAEHAPITLAGAQPGDALILTKPIGSGVLMAAEMQYRAEARWITEAYGLMRQSQSEASALLSDATAMTDVTGFGLAGHLLALCSASGLGARLDWGQVPLMQGAETLTAEGLRSTLAPDNAALAAGRIQGKTHLLLFDPQTAGGLLAAIPGDTAETRLRALKNAGYPAARIGTLVEGGGLTVI
ncbi:MAG: selenide, water dikinase SelD [Pseudomonadota bacterium]